MILASGPMYSLSSYKRLAQSMTSMDLLGEVEASLAVSGGCLFRVKFCSL